MTTQRPCRYKVCTVFGFLQAFNEYSLFEGKKVLGHAYPVFCAKAKLNAKRVLRLPYLHLLIVGICSFIHLTVPFFCFHIKRKIKSDVTVELSKFII